QLVPANAPQPPATSIPDIGKHRTQALSYVRRLADYVELEPGPVDVDADPVLLIGDRPVSRAEFMRRVLMYSGEAEIDRHITYLLTEAEVARALASGADPAQFEVSEADVDRKFDELKESVAMQAQQQAPATPPAPGDPDPAEAAVQYYLDTIESSIGMPAYRKLLAADARFERVFLPLPEPQPKDPNALPPAPAPPALDAPRPDWMPQATWDALGGDEQSQTLRSFVVSWGEEGSEIPAIFRTSVLQTVRAGLIRQTGVKFFFDEELPADVLLRVGDHLVKSADIWPLVRPGLADADVELIVRELLMLEGMRATLEASGRWLDDEQFVPEWKAENDKFAGTFIPLDKMIMFRGYSSLDRYREHFRYRQAYYLWRRSTLTDDEVLAHYQGGGRLFFERGSIVVDLAYAPLKGQPFTAANLEARRAELADAIAAARATDTGDTPAGQTPVWWQAVAQRFPPPPAREGIDAHALPRSQLRLTMTEDELAIFLAGYSLADDAFYHGRPGEIFGPFVMECRRHAWGAETNAGAWAVYVRDFSRRQTLQPFEGAEREMAYEDYLDLNYFYWSSECLAALAPKVRLP
ncbi:MAG TPA: hypothetical protein VFD43_01450, partial [Planctomycetota bacterium]|nr:hypothetical protein [Planctomycetota bacterium]